TTRCATSRAESRRAAADRILSAAASGNSSSHGNSVRSLVGRAEQPLYTGSGTRYFSSDYFGSSVETQCSRQSYGRCQSGSPGRSEYANSKAKFPGAIADNGGERLPPIDAGGTDFQIRNQSRLGNPCNP